MSIALIARSILHRLAAALVTEPDVDASRRGNAHAR
jgi:hypothetical protein